MDGSKDSQGFTFRRSFSLDSGLVKAPSNLDVVINPQTSQDEVIQAWLEYSKYVPTFLRQSILRFGGCLNLVPERVRFEDITPCSDRRFTAVGVVDISGFTSMTRRKGRVGPLGAEVLHTFLDQYFDLLISEAEQYGGDVFKIAGDAIIFFFIPNEEETKQQVCARAAACIHNLVVSLGCVKFSRYGTVEIVPRDAEERATDDIEHGCAPMDRKASEPPLHWFPVEHVDAGIDERVGHCLESIVTSILKNDLSTRPNLRTGRAKLRSTRDVYSGMISRREKAKAVLRQVGADLWQVYEKLVADFSQYIMEAQSLSFGESMNLVSADPDGLCAYDGTSLHQPGEEEVWDSELVYTKGILSCGDLVYYRVKGEEKMGGFVEPGPLWECVAADSIGRSGNGAGCFSDISAMDQAILPSQVLLSASFFDYIRDFVSVARIGCFGSGLGNNCDKVKSGIKSGIVQLVDVQGPKGRLCTLCTKQSTHRDNLSRERDALRGYRLQTCVMMLRSLASHVPAAVRSILSGSSGAPLAAHRTASILFFGFPGLRSSHSLDLIQQIMRIVSGRLASSGGDLLTMRNDEKGVLIIAGHGLPGHARGLDYLTSTIALKDAVEIASTVEAATGQAVVVGLATGRVLFTSVGSNNRREYTVYGEAMNRAAKIMTIGASLLGSAVICDDVTRALIMTTAETLEVRFDELKGTNIHSQTLYVVRGRGHGSEKPSGIPHGNPTALRNRPDQDRLCSLAPPLDHNIPFKRFLDVSNATYLGAQAEIATLLGHVSRLMEGVGSTICIEGLAGTGKTFLLEQVFSHRLKSLKSPQRPAVAYVTSCATSPWAGELAFPDVLVRDFSARRTKATRNGGSGIDNYMQGETENDRERWARSLCQILHLDKNSNPDLGEEIELRQAREMRLLVDDYIESKNSTGLSDSKTSGLHHDQENDVLAGMIVFALTRYADARGPLVIIMDSMEHAHVSLWSACCQIHAMKSGRILLVLAFRWPYLTYRTMAESSRLARTESAAHGASVVIGHARKLEVAALDVGMLHWLDPKAHPVDTIPSELGRFVCTIFFDESVTKIATPSWSVADIKEYMRRMFPGAHPPPEAYELIDSITGGNPYSVKFVAVFLYLYHQLKESDVGTRNIMDIPMAMLAKVRTFSPLWPAAQIRVDTLTSSLKQLAIRMVLIGEVVPEQLIIAFCHPEISEATVRTYLQFLTFMRYINAHRDEDGSTYYTFLNRALVSITLDMIAVDARKRLRARLAALLERFKYRRGGVDWKVTSYNWLLSCQLSQEIHWKRCLRSIASCEQYALVCWKQEDYRQVQRSLANAVLGAMILLTRHVRQRHDEERIAMLVPTWRVAGWERAIAGCELLLQRRRGKSSQGTATDPADACLARVSTHCRRALTLLRVENNPPTTGCSLSALTKPLRVLGYQRDTLRALACPGAPGRSPRTALLPSVSNGLEIDSNLETVAFLPGKHSNEESERKLEIGRVSRLLELTKRLS